MAAPVIDLRVGDPGIRCLPTAEPERALRHDNVTSGMRVDPTTGLYAFADFLTALPQLAGLCADTVAGTCGVGIAVGDVDGLKSLIEARPDPETGLSGHLRGHFFMSSFGATVRDQVDRLGVAPVVMATFGGDEMLLIMPAPCPMTFELYLDTMRGALSERLPRTMSFAWTWRHADPVDGGAAAQVEYSQLLMELDSCLVACKRARAPGSRVSFCEQVSRGASLCRAG